MWTLRKRLRLFSSRVSPSPTSGSSGSSSGSSSSGGSSSRSRSSSSGGSSSSSRSRSNPPLIYHEGRLKHVRVRLSGYNLSWPPNERVLEEIMAYKPSEKHVSWFPGLRGVD